MGGNRPSAEFDAGGETRRWTNWAGVPVVRVLNQTLFRNLALSSVAQLTCNWPIDDIDEFAWIRNLADRTTFDRLMIEYHGAHRWIMPASGNPQAGRKIGGAQQRLERCSFVALSETKPAGSRCASSVALVDRFGKTPFGCPVQEILSAAALGIALCRQAGRRRPGRVDLDGSGAGHLGGLAYHSAQHRCGGSGNSLSPRFAAKIAAHEGWSGPSDDEAFASVEHRGGRRRSLRQGRLGAPCPSDSPAAFAVEGNDGGAHLRATVQRRADDHVYSAVNCKQQGFSATDCAITMPHGPRSLPSGLAAKVEQGHGVIREMTPPIPANSSIRNARASAWVAKTAQGSGISWLSCPE